MRKIYNELPGRREVYQHGNGMHGRMIYLRAELTGRRVQLRRHDNKAQLVELTIVLRFRSGASGDGSSGAMSFDLARLPGI